MADVPPQAITAGALAAYIQQAWAAFGRAATSASSGVEYQMAVLAAETVLTVATPGLLAAERARLRAEIDPAQLDKLADWFDTDDEFKTTMFPETWPQRGHEVQDDLRRWAALLRERP